MNDDKFEHLYQKVETLHDLFKDLNYLTQKDNDKINDLELFIQETKNRQLQTETILEETETIATSIRKKYFIKNATIAGISGLMLDCIVPFSSSICYGIGILGVCGYELCFKNTPFK